MSVKSIVKSEKSAIWLKLTFSEMEYSPKELLLFGRVCRVDYKKMLILAIFYCNIFPFLSDNCVCQTQLTSKECKNLPLIVYTCTEWTSLLWPPITIWPCEDNDNFPTRKSAVEAAEAASDLKGGFNDLKN